MSQPPVQPGTRDSNVRVGSFPASLTGVAHISSGLEVSTEAKQQAQGVRLGSSSGPKKRRGTTLRTSPHSRVEKSRTMSGLKSINYGPGQLVSLDRTCLARSLARRPSGPTSVPAADSHDSLLTHVVLDFKASAALQQGAQGGFPVIGGGNNESGETVLRTGASHGSQVRGRS